MALSNDYVRELVGIGPFAGIDATTAPVFVAQDKLVDALNVVPNRAYSGYATVRGRVLENQLFSAPYAFAKFVRAGFPTVWIALTSNGGVPTLQAFQLGQAPQTLTLPVGARLTLAPAQFTAAGTSLFLATPGQNDTPLKIAYDTLAVTFWGIAAPATAPITSIAGAGSLNFLRYQYVVTFGATAAGVTIQESSNGPLSPALAATSQQITLSSIPVSSDPQVSERNIYRLDSGGQFRLVATLADNTTTTYTDNLADIAVTGQVLVPRRDTPKPFLAIKTYQNAVWGFGYTSSDPRTRSDLLYSNSTEPGSFDYVDNYYAVGENAGDDVAVAVANTGTYLVLLKSRTFWLLYGTPGNYTAPYEAAQIGCVSARSVAESQGVVFWFAGAAGVFAFDGGAPQYLSADIKSFIDALALADMQAASGFYYDRMYHLSFPTIGVTWLYDTRTKGWWKLGFSCTIATFDESGSGEVVADNAFTLGEIDQWFADEEDLGAPIGSLIITRVAREASSFGPEATKQYRYMVILAPPQNATVTATITADPGPRAKIITRVVSLTGANQARQISIPGFMKGREIQFKLSIVSNARVEIHRAAVYGYILRRFGNNG